MGAKTIGSLCVFLALVVCAPGEVDAGSAAVCNGSVVIEAGDVVVYRVQAPLAASGVFLRGRLQTAGDEDSVRIQVLGELDYARWQAGDSVKGSYDSGRVTATELDVPLPGAEEYIVLLDNRFSASTSKTIHCSVTLHWGEPWRGEEINVGVVAFVAFALVGWLLAALATGVVLMQRKRDT